MIWANFGENQTVYEVFEKVGFQLEMLNTNCNHWSLAGSLLCFQVTSRQFYFDIMNTIAALKY